EANTVLDTFDRALIDAFDLEEEPTVVAEDDSIVITTSFETTCETLLSSDSTVVRVITVDAETNEMQEEVWYKNSESEDNRILTVTVETTEEDVRYADVSEEFTLNSSV